MKFGDRSRKGGLWLTLFCVIGLWPTRARAEFTLYDQDGWTIKTDGLAQGFYTHTSGDAAPVGPLPYVRFDQLDTGVASANGTFAASRFRSGWTGGRFNWRVTNQVSPNIKASAYLGIAYSISTQNRPAAPGGLWDVRNGYLEIESPWGILTVGRQMGLYSSGAYLSTARNTSATYGLGNACGTGGDNLACYTSGYGVKFPGFWAGLVYTAPKLGNLTIKLAALDPVAVGHDRSEINADGMLVPVSQAFAKTPLPHFQGLAYYELTLGRAKLNPFFSMFVQTVGRTDTATATNQTLTARGAGGGFDLLVGALSVGVGGYAEKGSNLFAPLVGDETVDGEGKLRSGGGFYVHGKFTFFGAEEVSLGYGHTTLDQSTFDFAKRVNMNLFQRNIHAAFEHHVGPLTFVAELNLLHHEYQYGNTQNVGVISAGANFAY